MKKIEFYLLAAAVLLTIGCAEELDKNKFKYDLKYLAVSDVKLNKNTLTLSWNSSETLRATVSPERADNRAISWSSSNESIATVTSLGEVVAVGVGEADITVTSEDDASKKDVCKVTVNPWVLLGNTELTLLVDEKVTISGSVVPPSSPQALTWTVENKEDDKDKTFATVSATGEVTAVANGKTTVRATITGTKLSATCAVTVGNVPVEKVELNKSLSPIQIGETETLTATIVPANAWNKNVEWKVKGTTLSLTLTENPFVVKVTRVAEGDASVTVITEDGGKVATCDFAFDPHAFFTGETGSKTWEWDKFKWDPLDLKRDPWWSIEDVGWDDYLVTTYKSKEGKGATMTFTYKGLKLLKTRTDGSTVEGTFKVDMSKSKVCYDWPGPPTGPKSIYSIGQITTKDVSILFGREMNIDNVYDGRENEGGNSSKKPLPGKYPNGEADIPEAFVLDIIKLSDDQLVFGYHNPGIDMMVWDGAWYWYFKPKK